eukprot:scaffold1397_cov254-Pinguiococcus_pyrenoidosus.AAC.54
MDGRDVPMIVQGAAVPLKQLQRIVVGQIPLPHPLEGALWNSRLSEAVLGVVRDALYLDVGERHPLLQMQSEHELLQEERPNVFTGEVRVGNEIPHVVVKYVLVKMTRAALQHVVRDEEGLLLSRDCEETKHVREVSRVRPIALIPLDDEDVPMYVSVTNFLPGRRSSITI